MQSNHHRRSQNFARPSASQNPRSTTAVDVIWDALDKQSHDQFVRHHLPVGVELARAVDRLGHIVAPLDHERRFFSDHFVF
jgi:hypothetical protein